MRIWPSFTTTTTAPATSPRARAYGKKPSSQASTSAFVSTGAIEVVADIVVAWAEVAGSAADCASAGTEPSAAARKGRRAIKRGMRRSERRETNNVGMANLHCWYATSRLTLRHETTGPDPNAHRERGAGARGPRGAGLRHAPPAREI